MTQLDAALWLAQGAGLALLFILAFAGAGCALVWLAQNAVDRYRARRAAR